MRLGQRFRRAAANGTAKPQRIGGDIVSNAFHSSRNFYFRQTVTSQKNIRAQRLQPLRKPERRKAGAVIKSLVSYRLNAVRHDDLRQPGAASKRRISDRNDAVRKNHRRQRSIPFERGIPDDRHSVRNRDRRSVARVLLQRQARRAAVAVKGVSQLKIFHPKVVLRLGQRFRRAAANGTAKPQRIGGDIVSNAFHSSRNFYFRQTVTSQKNIRAQRLQPLRKPERRKAGAVIKSLVSYRLNAVRHDDLRQPGAASKRVSPD